TAIGRQMALALMTTFYGVLLANLIFKPVAVKLERRTEQRLVAMNTVMQGISMLSRKRSPAMLRETLNAFVAEVQDEIIDHAVAATDAPSPGKWNVLALKRDKPASGTRPVLSVDGTADKSTGAGRP